MYSHAALFVDFKVLDDPLTPGGGVFRTIILQEFPVISDVISIEISGGDSIGPVPFHVLPLTYDEYEARFPNMNLDNIFPSRPLDPAGGIWEHS